MYNKKDMVKTIFCSILMLLLSVSCAYPMVLASQASEEGSDWDEIDYHIFLKLKEDLGQSDAEVYEAMGWNHVRHENWERAATYFKKAVSLNSRLFWSWYNLGLLHIDIEEGDRYLKKAIDVKPDYPASYYWLAYSHCKNRKDKEAIKIFKKYLELAEGIPTEDQRYKKARRILAELFAGREGKELWKIRKLDW
ncbi:tetratricopeptide repeat protein [Candidatus Omnitrophota bacterium]